MAIYTKHNDTVKIAIPYVKHNDEIKIPTSGWTKTGGELKQIWSSPIAADGTVYIDSQEALEVFRALVNSGNTSLNGTLTADITLTGEWTPIANYSSDTSLQYTGTFDGDGHTITGLTINSESSYQGLFGYIGSGGTVKNVKLVSTSVFGYNRVGGIAGQNYDGIVQNCTNSGTVSDGADSGAGGGVGGIIGHNYGRDYGIVQNCTNEGTVSGNYAGGIVGQNANFGIVQNCTNSATVSGSARAGGIAGANNNSGTISNNINSGNVTATGSSGSAGGIVGYNSSYGTVSGNTNTGTVTGTNITTVS